jgi:serine/threonine protein phosphatase PrpC
MPLPFCCETDAGRQRQVNQDALLTDPKLDLFVVADGMGGHKHGDVASRLIVDSIARFFRETTGDSNKTWPFAQDPRLGYAANQLRASILVANRHICEQRGEAEERSMGATLVAALFGRDRVVVANVGDCRAYLMDQSGLRQITRDHSWVAEQVEAGFITPETARAHPWRSMVTRAVQGEVDLKVDTTEFLLASPSRMLLCSDGLHVVLSDEDIARILRESPGTVDSVCRALVRTANDRGAPDNVSVIVIDWPSQA